MLFSPPPRAGHAAAEPRRLQRHIHHARPQGGGARQEGSPCGGRRAAQPEARVPAGSERSPLGPLPRQPAAPAARAGSGRGTPRPAGAPQNGSPPCPTCHPNPAPPHLPPHPAPAAPPLRCSIRAPWWLRTPAGRSPCTSCTPRAATRCASPSTDSRCGHSGGTCACGRGGCDVGGGAFRREGAAFSAKGPARRGAAGAAGRGVRVFVAHSPVPCRFPAAFSYDSSPPGSHVPLSPPPSPPARRRAVRGAAERLLPPHTTGGRAQRTRSARRGAHREAGGLLTALLAPCGRMAFGACRVRGAGRRPCRSKACPLLCRHAPRHSSPCPAAPPLCYCVTAPPPRAASGTP